MLPARGLLAGIVDERDDAFGEPRQGAGRRLSPPSSDASW